MSDLWNRKSKLPPEQQAIRDRCFHPSGTFVEFPMEDVETSIPERFAKIARKYPERIAIRTLEKALTYAELDLAANRVARAIGAFQKTDHEPIGIFLEPGIDRIVAFLGVLKSANFFVPMNPSWPRSQLAEIQSNTLWVKAESVE